MSRLILIAVLFWFNACEASTRLLPSIVAEHELAGIDFFLTFLKQVATLAMFMAIGIPISYNHFVLAIVKTLFGIYPYLQFYT